ncbi:hypothetical protein NA56DRAFT_607466, partial [Hyaloscypha hepaticicola]
MAHIFWHTEWLKVLWSDEVTFLIGGRTAKEKVTRKRGECHCETCIQYQLHRGHMTPVNTWGAIGYGYKSPLIFIHAIRETFSTITHLLYPLVEPLFMEDGNSAHGHKSTSNCCTKWRTTHGIILMPHPSTSPDMNPIEKYWRRIKQALHRRKHQPTTEAQMEQAVIEEWEAIPQEWINQLV